MSRFIARQAKFMFWLYPLALVAIVAGLGIAHSQPQQARPLFTPKGGAPAQPGAPAGPTPPPFVPRPNKQPIPIGKNMPVPPGQAGPMKIQPGQPLQPGQPGKPLKPGQKPDFSMTPNPNAPAPTPKPQIDQTPIPPYKPQGLTLYFIGQRNGEIEPCGCTHNQLGGVQYEASIYEMSEKDSSLRVDVGGWMPPTIAPEGSMKATYALHAMGDYLKFDAVNLSRVDLENGKAYFDEVKAKFPDAVKPLVSANVFLKSDPEKRPFDAYKIVERKLLDGKTVRCAIIGVTSEVSPVYASPQTRQEGTSEDYVFKKPNEVLKPILEELKDKADVRVLLCYANAQEITEIAKANPELDTIIVPVPMPSNATKVEGSNAKILAVHGGLGKTIGRADLLPAEGGGWKMAGDAKEPDYIGVAPKLLKPHEQMVKLIDDFKAETVKGMEPVNKEGKRIYAGTQMCASCHQPEYQQWKTTPHSHALETLIKKNSQYRSECLQCHVVGFKKENGFYNVKDSFSLGGVQCENCHGPAAEHAEKENLIRNKSVNSMQPAEKEKFLADAKKLIPPKIVEASTCVQCHVGENDPNFNYEVYLPKVKHDQPKDQASVQPPPAK